jgi:hypothetical protein
MEKLCTRILHGPWREVVSGTRLDLSLFLYESMKKRVRDSYESVQLKVRL